MFYRVNAFYLQDSWNISNRLTAKYGVRFDHIGPWLNAYPGGMAVFNPSAYTNTAVSGQFPGLTWHAFDPSVPTSGIYNYPWPSPLVAQALPGMFLAPGTLLFAAVGAAIDTRISTTNGPAL